MWKPSVDLTWNDQSAKRGIQCDRVFTLGKSLQHLKACSIVLVISLIIRDMSPLFCAQSSPGKSFPHVPVR